MKKEIAVSGEAIKQVARFLLVMLAIFSHTGNAQAIQGGSSTAVNSCSNCETQANAEIKVHNSSQHSVQQIELQRCDSLPIIKARVNGKEMPFLLDTAGNYFVNQKSFGSVASHALRVYFCTGMTVLKTC